MDVLPTGPLSCVGAAVGMHCSPDGWAHGTCQYVDGQMVCVPSVGVGQTAQHAATNCASFVSTSLLMLMTLMAVAMIFWWRRGSGRPVEQPS